jgi:hypothetical protein
MSDRKPLLSIHIDFHPRYIESQLDYNGLVAPDREQVVAYLRGLANTIEGREDAHVIRYSEGRVLTIDKLPITADEAELFKEPDNTTPKPYTPGWIFPKKDDDNA